MIKEFNVLECVEFVVNVKEVLKVEEVEFVEVK